MAKQHQRRRQIVVNKKYQNRIVFAISWPPALCLILTAVALGIFCWKLSIEALEADAELPSLVPVFLTTIGFLVIASVFQYFNALKFSHRVAGPVVNIARILKDFRGGNLSARVHLRRGDLVMDIADEVNGFLDWLEDHPPSGMDREAELDKKSDSDAELAASEQSQD
ncbi:MAG: hypothetical protein ACYTG5_20350 [Planctomycetota bacterium]|jgi:hypothetical protein